MWLEAGQHLYGKLELLALEHLSVVDVEEVAVKNRLDETGKDGDPVDLVVGLGEVAVQPVWEVETSVYTESEEVVRRDGLGLSSALEHEELRENGDGLEPDGESPKDLGDGVLVGEKQSQNSSATD